MQVALSNLNLFKVVDTESGTMHAAGDQEWYGTEWQRRSGCGPTTVSNILWYLGRRFPELPLPHHPATRAGRIALMEDVWHYVTPTRRGIPTTPLLYEPAQRYFAARGLALTTHICDIPEAPELRPSWDELVAFLNNALSRDLPVAFLNLCNGAEEELDPWHWVTLVALEGDAPDTSLTITVLDGEKVRRSDLALWYRTTRLGGGFVYFTP